MWGNSSKPTRSDTQEKQERSRRLIMHLSALQGHSVNEGISRELCTCHYTSVDQAAEQIVRWGKGTLMAKMDIKQVYRNIPIAPKDRHLLGFQWDGNIFINKVLPFGLRDLPVHFHCGCRCLIMNNNQSLLGRSITSMNSLL